jgi:RHS repeat-associated protein
MGTAVTRHKANTKEEDPTGLLNEGFRYRDIETGSFITRDPTGFVDGPNLYTYVNQNPWTSFDPRGLDTQTIARQYVATPQPTPTPQPNVLQRAGAAIGRFFDRLGASLNSGVATTQAPISIHNAATIEGRSDVRRLADIALQRGEISTEDHREIVGKIANLNAPEMGMYQGGARRTRDKIYAQGRQLVKDAMAANTPSSPNVPDQSARQTRKSSGEEENIIRLRHYTNTQGISGIEETRIIVPGDHYRVYFERANKKPLSKRDAEDFHRLKRGHGQHYVETDVPESRVEYTPNPIDRRPEPTVRGPVPLSENAEIVKRSR